MSKNFWKDLASAWPISALAPMDGYTDSAYRQIVKKIAPETVCFTEFFSADGLVHSKQLRETALSHDASEKPLIVQIFGKDPEMFRKAAIHIEQAGAAGVDVNMGCPAKKVVRSGHGSSLMINTDTAFRIIEEMSRAVSIPVSVKTRLGWDNYDELIPFALGLQNAGADLITVHGRTYKQAFWGTADWTGIYELKRQLQIPVIGNGDVADYDDGIKRLGNLDWFMIWRKSFGNPWCFLPGGHIPTLAEILAIMSEHTRLLFETKGQRGIFESRKHLVQYLHGFAGVKEYRKSLVTAESLEDIKLVLERIGRENL